MNILCISCDVTKDLLTPYLDGVCSDESKALVENHLKDCAACREFLTKLQEQDLGKDAPKVDYLKKTKKTIKQWSVAAVTASLFLLFFILLNTNQTKFRTDHYFWGLPVLMLVLFFAVNRGCQIARPAKWSWLLPAASALITVASPALSAFIFLFVTERISSTLPLNAIGPIIHYGYIALAIAAILLLIVMTDLAHKKQQFFPFSQNLACLGFALAMLSDSFLYNMSTPQHIQQAALRTIGILTLEFVAVTALLIVIKRTAKSTAKS